MKKNYKNFRKPFNEKIPFLFMKVTTKIHKRAMKWLKNNFFSLVFVMDPFVLTQLNLPARILITAAKIFSQNNVIYILNIYIYYIRISIIAGF